MHSRSGLTTHQQVNEENENASVHSLLPYSITADTETDTKN